MQKNSKRCKIKQIEKGKKGPMNCLSKNKNKNKNKNKQP